MHLVEGPTLKLDGTSLPSWTILASESRDPSSPRDMASVSRAWSSRRDDFWRSAPVRPPSPPRSLGTGPPPVRSCPSPRGTHRKPGAEIPWRAATSRFRRVDGWHGHVEAVRGYLPQHPPDTEQGGQGIIDPSDQHHLRPHLTGMSALEKPEPSITLSKLRDRGGRWIRR